MPVAVYNPAELCKRDGGGWVFSRWASSCAAAGITDRACDRMRLLKEFSSLPQMVEAEQIHGSSVAVVETAQNVLQPVKGCDALITNVPGLILVIRSADCIPIFFADSSKRVVALAHAGWRGIASLLPLRMIAALHHTYKSCPDDVHVAIGPAIRACCYEVGPEFVQLFGPFVEQGNERCRCDLTGAAIAQLQEGGIRKAHITDCERCTACDTQHWFSLRREGSSTGRMSSFIMLRP